MIRICDLHCDTLYNIRKNGGTLIKNNGHITLKKLNEFESFIQVMAMWSEHSLTCDEAYDAFLDAAGILERELVSAEAAGYKVRLAKSGNDILKNEDDGFSSVVFAVEGGKLLDNSLKRLEMLYSLGVRILTLVWAGECPIGGAHNNEVGLTPFGKEVVRLCFELGIIPDVSHANERQINEVLEIATTYSKPIMASHSNSKTVHNHTRNLTNEQYKEIVKLGGTVGVSMACEHLCESRADINDLVRHIRHYFDLSPKGVCLGSDFDGVTSLPDKIVDVTSLKKLATLLEKSGFSKGDVENIMYNNARDFLVKNLGLR